MKFKSTDFILAILLFVLVFGVLSFAFKPGFLAKGTEVIEKRSYTSKTYSNGDGSYYSDFSLDRIHYFDGLIKLGYSKFDVIVAQGCAGIESLVLFFVMYLVAASIEFKKLNKKRFVFALVFGLILLFLISIIRLYFIMLSGLLINPAFAVQVVHRYSSLIIFVVFFLIYWNYSFKWVKS